MPWNGSGVFEREYDWTTDRDGGVKITATRVDSETDGIVGAINDIVAGTRDFKGPIKVASGTASLPGYAFSEETNSGWYRIGSANFGFSIAGTKYLDVQASALAITTTTVTVNGNTVWHEGNDGAGSNLDADKVHGVDGATLTVGPGSATDKTIPRFDGGTGKLLKGSDVVIDDSNNVAGIATLITTGPANIGSAITAGGNTVWHAGNDGAGSGLDADLIDGVELSGLVQTSRSISAGSGLSGGGALSADRTLSLDISSLTTQPLIDPDADFMPYTDATTGLDRKALIRDIVSSVAQPAVILRYVLSAHGGVAGTGWVKYPLNQKSTDDGTAVSFSSSVLTLPAGTYRAEWQVVFVGALTGKSTTRLRNTTDSTTVEESLATTTLGDLISVTNSGCSDAFTTTSNKSFQLEYQTENRGNDWDLGRAGSGTSPFQYGFLKIWRLG